MIPFGEFFPLCVSAKTQIPRWNYRFISYLPAAFYSDVPAASSGARGLPNVARIVLQASTSCREILNEVFGNPKMFHRENRKTQKGRAREHFAKMHSKCIAEGLQMPC